MVGMKITQLSTAALRRALRATQQTIGPNSDEVSMLRQELRRRLRAKQRARTRASSPRGEA